MSLFAELFFVFIGTAFVLLLAWALLRSLNRIKYRPTDHDITLLSVRPIGPKEKIIALQFHNTTYLIAVASGSTTLLDRLTTPNSESDEKQPGVMEFEAKLIKAAGK